MVWPELNVDFNVVKGDDVKMRNVVIQKNFRKDGCCGKRNAAQFFYVRIGIFLLALSSGCLWCAKVGLAGVISVYPPTSLSACTP